jgi:uncharacterized protein
MNTTRQPTTAAAPAATASPAPALPWWRVPMVWVVISGPLAVVVASLATAAVAWRHIDPVLETARPGHAQAADDDVALPQSARTNPKDSLAPAMKARNHAATPER